MTTNTAKLNAAGHYRFGNWRDKAFGPKPSEVELATAHLLGCRPGKQALALAMALRDTGASAFQQVDACTLVFGESGTHNNKRRALVSGGLVREVPTPADLAGHKVYRIELTVKGKAKVAAAEKLAAARAEAASAVKPAKGAKGQGNGAKRASKPASVTVAAPEAVVAAQPVDWGTTAAQISSAADKQA